MLHLDRVDGQAERLGRHLAMMVRVPVPRSWVPSLDLHRAVRVDRWRGTGWRGRRRPRC